MQIKITVISLHPPMRITKLKKKRQEKMLAKDLETLDHSYIAGGSVKMVQLI